MGQGDDEKSVNKMGHSLWRELPYQLQDEPMNIGYSKPQNNQKLSKANRPGRYRFLFCG